MPENVEAWWARRQRSKGAAVPYAVGTYRTDWERYSVLVRQYHPDLNHGVTLTQIPPAADVYLLWECDSGHRFVATPEEQRQRPGRSRRRSTWCPECAAGATPQRVRQRAAPMVAAGRDRESTAQPVPPPLIPPARGTRSQRPRLPTAVPRPTVEIVDRMRPGDAFRSALAPLPSSRAEAGLRQRLAERLDVDLTPNAVRISGEFFSRREVWPDIVIAELRVAIEYDTTGRDGLEHVGQREDVDRRKDRMLRAVGWEVVRIRCGKLQTLGPHDLTASGVSGALIDRIVDRLGEVRGHLIVSAYLRAR